MGVKITYLLGAGASYNSIPIVKDFKSRMEFHISSFENNSELESYVEDLKWLHDESFNFSTIDTYAKYLYLNRQNDLEEKYSRLKNALSLFFIIEQTYQFDFNRLENSFPDNLDKRYLSFLVSIFNSKNWPNDIKILSWNYDFQFELACQIIDTDLANYWPKYNGEELSIEHNIIHLNGVAHLFEDLKIDKRKEIKEIEKIWRVHNNKIQLSNKAIKFAWESNINLDKISSFLIDTDILVIIGYSFPFFNRKTDNAIFEYFKKPKGKLKKIYFQNLNLKGEFLYDQFDIPRPGSTKSFSDPLREIEYENSIIQITNISKCESFHIPFEY